MDRRFTKVKANRSIGEPEATPEKEAEVRLTSADIRNGWTQESLAKYLAQRNVEKQQYAMAMASKAKLRPIENVSTYNPHSWRS